MISVSQQTPWPSWLVYFDETSCRVEENQRQDAASDQLASKKLGALSPTTCKELSATDNH